MSKVPVKVIWLREVNTRFGKCVKRVEAVLVCVDEFWATLEVNGERFAAETSDLRLAA